MKKNPAPKKDFAEEPNEKVPEVEAHCDHTKFALRRMMDIANGYQEEIEYLMLVQGNIADLNIQNRMMQEFIESHIDMDEDEE